MAHASVILLWIAYLLYAGAFALFVVQFLTKSPTLTRVGLVVAASVHGVEALGDEGCEPVSDAVGEGFAHPA